MTDLTARGAPVVGLVRATEGTVLAREAYNAEIDRHLAGCAEPCWKLERMQHFSEPDVPSWLAAHQGDWKRARSLIETMRPQLRAMSGSLSLLRRVRVVERPVSPYLQWEMHVFLARTDAGETIHTVDAAALAAAEGAGRLPELVILGSRVMYEVLYDAAGGHTGGRRIEEPAVIRACTDELAALFASGERFRDYFDREIAPLPPPRTV